MHSLDRRTLLAAGGVAVLPFDAGERPSAAWVPKSALSWPVQEIYCAVSGGRIVIAGGLRRGTGAALVIEDRTGVYDPATDVWSEGPRLPAPRHHPMLVAGDDGPVRLFGGYGRSAEGDWSAMTDVWALEGDHWAPAGRMPERLCETVGVSVAGRMHLVTGRSPSGSANGQWNDQADVATHLVYDPAGDRWETARPCPMARNSAAGAVLDGAIWIAGGRTVSGGGTGRLDRYDPAADRWDAMAPIPRSYAANHQVGGGLAMAAAGGKLVAFGGEWFVRGGGGVFAETWLYDPAADRWEAGPAMRTPRHGLAAAAVDGVIYAIAGGEVASGGRAGGVVEALA